MCGLCLEHSFPILLGREPRRLRCLLSMRGGERKGFLGFEERPGSGGGVRRMHIWAFVRLCVCN